MQRAESSSSGQVVSMKDTAARQARPICESADLVHEQAYLVSRGVRPLSLIGHIAVESEFDVERAKTELMAVRPYGAAEREPIPVVMIRQDRTCADIGFAARAWVVDLLKWLDENAPTEQQNRIVGLLLGYSADAIASLEELEAGFQFSSRPTWPEPVSS